MDVCGHECVFVHACMYAIATMYIHVCQDDHFAIQHSIYEYTCILCVI